MLTFIATKYIFIITKTWFQQDGANAHTARATMTAVRKVFR